jgi:hypothetical protein
MSQESLVTLASLQLRPQLAAAVLGGLSLIQSEAIFSDASTVLDIMRLPEVRAAGSMVKVAEGEPRSSRER